jgi:hypothetical protein
VKIYKFTLNVRNALIVGYIRTKAEKVISSDVVTFSKTIGLKLKSTFFAIRPIGVLDFLFSARSPRFLALGREREEWGKRLSVLWDLRFIVSRLARRETPAEARPRPEKENKKILIFLLIKALPPRRAA